MQKIQIDNFVRVIRFTFIDILKLKSLYVLFALMLMIIFCNTGSGSGSAVKGKYFRILHFHLISSGALLFSILLSMDVFKKDINTGKILMYLSRQMDRSVYILGRILGISIIVSLFMLLLHIALNVKITTQTGVYTGAFLKASFICMLNIFFISAFVLLCSFFVPGFIAAMTGIFVVGISFFIDTVHIIMKSELVKGLFKDNATGNSWFKTLWPKIYGLQYYTGHIIDGSKYEHSFVLHPFMNISIYLFTVYLITVILFRRRDITFEA